MSSKSVSSFLVNVSVIFNLSAPGAAKFVNPFALSKSDESSFEPINDSETWSPTRYDGLLV